jgi:hypothetical protein
MSKCGGDWREVSDFPGWRSAVVRSFRRSHSADLDPEAPKYEVVELAGELFIEALTTLAST